MDVREMLLTEFDQEMAATRPLLERVPMERGEFTPHPRSTRLDQLATHVARLPFFTEMVFQGDGFDFATTDRSQWGPVATHAELLALFEAKRQAARAALERADEEALAATWTLRSGEEVWLSEPRWLVHRRLMMNHLVHHRAQLGVYLRLLEVPIPGIYGPSAVEA